MKVFWSWQFSSYIILNVDENHQSLPGHAEWTPNFSSFMNVCRVSSRRTARDELMFMLPSHILFIFGLYNDTTSGSDYTSPRND
jgi:hypothetical protein